MLNNPQDIKEALKLKAHGSGIDQEWDFELVKNNTVLIAKNSFHCMNDSGYYMCWVAFTVKIPVENTIDFTLHFNGGSTAQYNAKKYFLRDMLEDTIFNAIVD
jgi:hypothetical protein